MGVYGALVRKLRPLIALLGFTCAGSVLFAQAVPSLPPVGIVWHAAIIMALVAAALLIMGFLDRDAAVAIEITFSSGAEAGEITDMRRVLGRNPVDWALLAFCMVGQPILAKVIDRTDLMVVGLSWCFLHVSATVVSQVER